MATRDFSKYFLYRWRYVIGYIAIGLLLAGLLTFAGFFLPGGLSAGEMRAVETTSQLSLSNPSSLAITDLPYHLLQAAFLSVFGISVFTIKLPSLIFALFSAVGLILLLRRWFKPGIAVMTSFIAITTGQFLYIAQLGTPSILFIFWPVVLLLLGTQITRIKKFRLLWKILFVIAVGLSLYTPLMIYPLLAIALAIIFHPHLRAVIRRLKRIRLIISTSILVALLLPLGWIISTAPAVGLTLLGLPDVWPPDIMANVGLLLQQYIYFWEPSTRTVMTPFFGLGSALLILLGLYRLFLTRETTRSYLIIFWILLLSPVLLLNPYYSSITFVPSVLMLAAGLTSLIGYWYRLFPFNPYARIVGLIPIVILVGALISTGLVRYVYGYHYNPAVVPLFSEDLKLLPTETDQLIVGTDELAFYEGVARYRDDIQVVLTPTEDRIVVTRTARPQIEGYTVERIIVNELSSNADRFYVMQRTQ